MTTLTTDPGTFAMRPNRRVGVFEGTPLTLHWFAGAAFLCGLASPIVIGIVGELYVGELLLMQLAFLLVLMGSDRRLLTSNVFRVLLQLAVLMLVGYVCADIYRNAHPAQFLRGWAKIIVVSLDIIALVIIIANDKRNLWWFILGMAIGGIGDAILREVPITTTSGWKSGYALPLASLLACLSCFVPIKLAAIGFIGLGICNIYMDFRILGAICVVVAAILWLRSFGQARISVWRLLQVIVVCLLAGAIVVGGLLLTQDEYAKRREISNVGRGAGLKVAASAIFESPLIGYGSWPMDARLVDRYHQEMEEVKQPGMQRRINSFVAHSQILQGWVEGGVLGVLFWFYYGYWLIYSVWYVARHRQADKLTPVFLVFLLYDLWSLLMSPFAGSTRFLIAIGIGITCICAYEKQNTLRPCTPV